jgi:hypothetical protein
MTPEQIADYRNFANRAASFQNDDLKGLACSIHELCDEIEMCNLGHQRVWHNGVLGRGPNTAPCPLCAVLARVRVLEDAIVAWDALGEPQTTPQGVSLRDLATAIGKRREVQP